MKRKEAIEKLEYLVLYSQDLEYDEVEAIKLGIKELKRKLKIGHWIVVSDGYGDNAFICECSECKDTVWVYKDADKKWEYCPRCGVRMKGRS